MRLGEVANAVRDPDPWENESLSSRPRRGRRRRRRRPRGRRGRRREANVYTRTLFNLFLGDGGDGDGDGSTYRATAAGAATRLDTPRARATSTWSGDRNDHDREPNRADHRPRLRRPGGHFRSRWVPIELGNHDGRKSSSPEQRSIFPVHGVRSIETADPWSRALIPRRSKDLKKFARLREREREISFLFLLLCYLLFLLHLILFMLYDKYRVRWQK